jgi:release factor glutamine methyltransferase
VRLPDPAVALVRVREALADGTMALAAADVDTPRLDAELLLAEVLGVDRARLVLDSESPLPPSALEAFEALLLRRVAREPVAYILGRRGFRRLTLAVDRRVLIPRPETELLVEVGVGLPSGVRVADVGTGSGAVALALKDERPDLDVVGIDLNKDAVAVARDNALRLGLTASFLVGDLLAGASGGFDAVLANLPYVASGASLAPEITEWEPASALFAGADGLDVIRRLLSQVEGVSLVALEIGFDQGDEVASLVRSAGFTSVERLRDLAWHERVIVGRR